MNRINKAKEDCCGCSACASICSHQAIKMEPDGLGFLYPKINNALCVDCGLCEKVCSFKSDYDHSANYEIPLAYAVRHKDMKEIETSRSGAAFIALSDKIINNGGVVYGAGYEGHFRVVHKRATSKEERNEFKGSKYVQSDINNVFSQVRADLREGLQVVFSGTPCQTSGLLSYVDKKLRKNLFLVDLVCHGVPAPYIWRDYLNFMEEKAGEEVIAVNFRDKSRLGWSAHKESFAFRRGITYSYTYTYTFYEHIMFRKSCGKCKFANLNRPSDVTLADFWGWQKVVPEFNADNKGISLVLVNTPKGKEWFDSVENEVKRKEVKIEGVMQPNLIHPTEIHKRRDDFERDYMKRGFIYVMKKYGNCGWKYKVKRSLLLVKIIVKRITRR